LSVESKSQKRYSKNGLWKFFLACVFPTHVWAIILILNDFGWVSERTSSSDAIGLGAYGLIFAFIDSVIIFGFLVILGFLISKTWGEKKRFALLTVVLIVIAFWEIGEQLFYFLNIQVPPGIINFLASSGHPLRILYETALILVTISLCLPVAAVLRPNRVSDSVWNFIDRISLLSTVYLALDFAALIIVIIRNLRL